MSILDETHWESGLFDPDDGLHEVPVTAAGALICDPIYLADYFNEENELVQHIRSNSVLFWNNFGGSIYYREPYIFIGGELDLPGFATICDFIGGDSGTLVIMGLEKPMPPALRSEVDNLLGKEGLSAVVKPAPGWYVPFGTEEDGSPVPSNRGPMVSVLKRIRGIEP